MGTWKKLTAYGEVNWCIHLHTCCMGDSGEDICWQDSRYVQNCLRTKRFSHRAKVEAKAIFPLMFFSSIFYWTHVHFWGHWYPCFRLLVTSPLCFKAKEGSLIHSWWRHMWYTFPEIHLWWDTIASVYGQHSSQLLSPHICFSRGRMPDLNHRPPTWQLDSPYHSTTAYFL